MRLSICLAMICLGGAAALAAEPDGPESEYAAKLRAIVERRAPGDGAGDAERLHELFKTSWDQWMRDSPEWATYVGYPGQNGRWTDNSPEAIERRKRETRLTLEALKSIARGALSREDALSFDLFKGSLELDVEGQRFPAELMPLNQLDGLQAEAARLLTVQPADTAAQYRDVLERLRALQLAIDQMIALMREGMKRGVIPPAVTLRDVPSQIREQLPEDDAMAPLLGRFQRIPSAIAEGERSRLKEEAGAAYREGARPALERLLKFLEAEYIPAARQKVGWLELPEGKEWYAYNARRHTTTAMTPEELHQLGLSEVARIRKEMDATIVKSEFKGSFAEFTHFLRTDPRFYFTSAEELLGQYRKIAKRIDPQLIRLFGKLPRLPYGVAQVPPYLAKSQTTAYYMAGSIEAGRAGYFYANTYDLKSRPKWEMEALTLHEAMPGHHLQISLAQEMEGTPDFRKNASYTAYVEGWGLYAESLGEELGLYHNVYSKFGQLTYEMWRAIRLVVDTGLHDKGWTREQAIEYFRSNTGRAEHDIAVEVDRYIVWPGQALAYKVGELKLKDLRRRATERLGEKFDLRKFHDALLEDGALPLDVLEAKMEGWIKERE